MTALTTIARAQIDGPFFEDFTVGQVFDEAPRVTLTSGHTALYQALFGDRLRLALDAGLCEAVTSRPEQLVHPNLLCNLVIGQTTGATQRVRANLFYRGLVLLRPVYVRDTISTRAEVVALKQNQVRAGKPATGLVALKIQAENQRHERLLDFWRCAMIPLRDPSLRTGHADSFDDIPAELDMEAVASAVPRWNLEVFRQHTSSGERAADLIAGTTYEVAGRDTVTCAPELARLTLNIAAAHTDSGASPYDRRLVYGGHTISAAAAATVRALPNLVTILAWRSCDHCGPVFEEDILRTELTVETVNPVSQTHRLVDLRAQVFATRGSQIGEEAEESLVLDWRFIGLMT